MRSRNVCRTVAKIVAHNNVSIVLFHRRNNASVVRMWANAFTIMHSLYRRTAHDRYAFDLIKKGRTLIVCFFLCVSVNIKCTLPYQRQPRYER